MALLQLGLGLRLRPGLGLGKRIGIALEIELDAVPGRGEDRPGPFLGSAWGLDVVVDMVNKILYPNLDWVRSQRCARRSRLVNSTKRVNRVSLRGLHLAVLLDRIESVFHRCQDLYIHMQTTVTPHM